MTTPTTPAVGHSAHGNPDPRIAELETLMAEEGIALPMPIGRILELEDQGYIVNLRTGNITAPTVSTPTPSGKAIAHLLKDHKGDWAL